MSAYPYYMVKSTHDHERITFLTTRVHHTKCTITHKKANTHTHTHTHTSCTMQAYRVAKINQTLPMFQGYGPARYKKDKLDIAVPKEHDPIKGQEKKT